MSVDSDAKIELDSRVMRETDKAILVTTGSAADAEWVPKSMCDEWPAPGASGGALVIAEWKARKLGWT
jgi:hypothetical protein